MKIGANIPLRNCIELDYPFRECIASLLPVCDVVSVCDGQSTDGTQEEIREWMKREPKLSLCVYEWKEPKGDPSWFVDWLNYGRQHVTADFQFQLDADEVLSELSYGYIEWLKAKPATDRFTVACNRLNFWRDHRHLIPHGQCCGHEVVRIAPVGLWLASDGYDPRGEEAASLAMKLGIDIMHYGFLRRREAFFKKEKLLQGYFFNSYDPRLEKAETVPGNWMESEGVTGWENNLIDFAGPHPKVAQAWLNERGYNA